MASPFKQKGKKPPAKPPAKKTDTSKYGYESKYGKPKAGYRDAKPGGTSATPTAVTDAKASESKGTAAKPHGAAGLAGRTSFAGAHKALALAKPEGSEEYTLASVLRPGDA
tara:strand:+ start:127 stop:459 length:333 start_codon:yes stop_codon:yes gene_type:complete